MAVRESPFPVERPPPSASADLNRIIVSKITPNPKNPRGKVGAKDVEDLTASVRAHGVLVPLIVREEGKGFVIVAGHRRFAAALEAGLNEVPCVVLESDKAQDLELALVENEQRLELDPLATAAAVADLMGRKGATIDGVSAILGKPRRWVALRAHLAKLSAKCRKERGKGVLEAWTAEMLVELAVLTPAEQDRLLETRWALEDLRDARDVRSLVGQSLRQLKGVPWDLADAKLVPAQGACTTCTRHSAASPSLFDEPAAAKLETALCRDGGCFDSKMTAARASLVKTKRAELGDKLVLVHTDRAGRMDHDDEAALKKATGQPVVDGWQYSKAKKDDKGAVPALVVDGPDQGTVRWLKKGRSSGGSNGRAHAPSKPASMKELRAALDKRRIKAATLEVRKALEKLPASAVTNDEHLLQLIAAFGVHPQDLEIRERPEKGQSEAWPGLHLAAVPRRAMLWAAVRTRVLHDHLRDWMVGSDRTNALMPDLCDSLDIPWKALLADQVAKIPEPQSWAARPAAPAKKGTKAKSKKAAKRARAT